MNTSKKTLVMAIALSILAGSMACAHAREWVWDDPCPVSPKVTRIAAGDELYGINEAGNIFVITLSVTEPGVAATPGPASRVLDVAAGPNEAVIAVMEGLIATWNAPLTFTPLSGQPKVPGSPGSYRQITVGSDGFVYVLFEKQTGEQYILKGRSMSDDMAVSFNPRTLDLKSRGNWVLCRLALPPGFTEKDIDPDSVEITRIQAPVSGGTPVDGKVSLFRAPGSPWSASHNFFYVHFLRYDRKNPTNPQSLDEILEGLLPAPASKKATYQVTVTVLARLKTTGEWFEGPGTLYVTVHKAK